MNVLHFGPDPTLDAARYGHLPKRLSSLARFNPTKGNVARDKRAARKRRHILARAPKR